MATDTSPLTPRRQPTQAQLDALTPGLKTGAARYGLPISHAPTGVLTEFGYPLREPCGRIHWAGTESSAVMCGWVDGAIRSDERTAEEVLVRETAAAG